MTPNDYQQAALRTAPGYLPPERLLLNGLMGLNGEAGEAIDILKEYSIIKIEDNIYSFYHDSMYLFFKKEGRLAHK